MKELNNKSDDDAIYSGWAELSASNFIDDLDIFKKAADTLFIPSILPDEYFVGYALRLAMLNQYLRIEDLWSFLSKKAHKNPRKPLPLFIYLSSLLEMCPRKFFLDHTNYSASHCPNTNEINLGEIFPKYYRGTFIRLNSSSYKASYLCRKCVLEDVKEFGYSYWHKSHQTDGDFCLKHSIVLASIRSNVPSASPGYYIKHWSHWVSNLPDDFPHDSFE